MGDIVKAVAAFHTQPAVIGRTVTPGDVQNRIVFDVIGEQTAHSAIGTDGIHRFVRLNQSYLFGWHERPGGTGLDTFTAADAGATAHGVVHIKDDLGLAAAQGVADDIVHLLFTTGTLTASALNTGVEIHGNGRVRPVRFRLLPRREARCADFQRARPGRQFRVVCIGGLNNV